MNYVRDLPVEKNDENYFLVPLSNKCVEEPLSEAINWRWSCKKLFTGENHDITTFTAQQMKISFKDLYYCF